MKGEGVKGDSNFSNLRDLKSSRIFGDLSKNFKPRIAKALWKIAESKVAITKNR
jgi:hypothetical protein